MESGRTCRRGIVLVLVGGLLAFLGLLAILALGTWRVHGALGRRAVHGTQALLAAEGGMEYAAARLIEEGAARMTDTVAGRGDDWTFRQGSGGRVEGSENPSYSHGEPWSDSVHPPPDGVDNDNDGLVDEPLEGDGQYTSGESGPDLDGDGRFSAWTGRLRGGDGPFDGRFSLSIRSPEGLLPVNAGYLDGLDRNGNGIPDCSDLEVDAYHAGLAHVLNNLGGLLLPYPDCPRRDDLQTGRPAGAGHTFTLSWLGNDLLGRRPQGGYGSWAGVEAALLDPSRPPTERYRPEDLERVRPFLDLGPYAGPAETGRVRWKEQYDLAPYAPVNLHTAPREALRSLCLYVTHWPRFGSEIDPLYGEQAGDRSPYPYAGPVSDPDTLPFEYVDHHMLYPDETDRLADRLVRLRRQGDLSWPMILRDLVAGAGDLFREEAAVLDVAGAPISKRSLLRYKAEIAFQVLSSDPHPFDGALSGLATWDGWGIDVDGDPANGVQQARAIGFHMLQRVLFPEEPGDGWPGGHGYADYAPLTIDGDGIAPQGGTLAPPARFDVESAGWTAPGGAAASASARLSAAEHLEFTSQEDFEGLAGGALLARRGITVLSGASRDVRPGQVENVLSGGTETRSDYPHVASLPRWSRRAITPDAGGAPYYGCARTCGALALAPLETGPQGSAYYWSFHEDADRDVLTDFWSEGSGGQPVRYPVRFLSDPADSEGTIPYRVSGDFSAPFACPGFTDVAEVPLRNGSIECWMAPEGYVRVLDKDKYYEIGIYSRRDTWADPARPATTFTVRVKWRNRWVDWIWDYWNVLEIQGGPFRVEDGAGFDPLEGHAHHVVLSFSFDGTATRFQLFVDGRDYATRPAEGPMAWMHVDPETGADGGLIATPQACIFLSRADEFRLHDRALQRPDAEKLYRLDRFVRSGLYVSPIYLFDAPARFTRTQWNGLVPPGLRDAGGFPFPSLRVEVISYDEAGVPTSAWLGPAGRIEDLSVLGKTKGFRYKVYFNCNPAAGVLTDSPVFESIWFTLRRQGRLPAWGQWSGR